MAWMARRIFGRKRGAVQDVGKRGGSDATACGSRSVPGLVRRTSLLSPWTKPNIAAGDQDAEPAAQTPIKPNAYGNSCFVVDRCHEPLPAVSSVYQR
ncbi:helicase C-terminal domain-containing protein [Pseudozyma hubeiensis SY62]|uniref:Helicase C-terminal domain-containing protein n=1 Tax=Pseudozyma hubeiensis (strain SY62) TaxID=1305764 RepID=R9NZX8_PSEHS|nr:helicase C-terminal domain-containing protein [Pseudozyma hubeiensis SY62]GAC94473.1 helicase C-terminal domain-containing protein [Pseudozyma hubeiensis SY62]